jgi:ribulose-phosphate 3-epimerase
MLDIRSKPSRPLVSVSILSADFAVMEQECRDVLDQGADLLHVDIMDGHFVKNLTMGPDMVRGVRKHLPGVFLDVHLMVERPERFVDAFADAGANLLSFHLEVCSPFHPNGVDPEALIEHIHRRGLAAGMVVNPYTHPQPLEPWLDALELVLVMSVVPGRSGQSFMPHVLPKAQWLRERVKDHTRVEMDGGLNGTTGPQAVAHGVDTLVTASYVFTAADRRAAIAAVRGEDRTGG